MILLLSTACGYKEYAGVPKIKTIELSNGEIAISYNGSIYRKNEEITSDNISGEYFLNFEDREVVAVWNYMWLGKLPIYRSTMDTEKMILQVQEIGATPSYYVKEGFELPDIENTEINKVFLQESMYDAEYGNACREYIDIYEGGLTLYEIVETNESMIEDQCVETCFLELEDYEYLKVGQISVYEADEQLYFCIGEDRTKTEAGYLCHKIKSEYQEVFRNAINQFNSMQAQ